MTETIPHLVWAAATGTVAYCGHRVAITWLNQRAAASERAEARDERDRGAVSQLEAMKKELHDMKVEQKSFLANLRAR